MNRDEALAVLRATEPQLRAYGIVRAAVFGSVSRGEADDGSDVDIVVTAAPDRHLDLVDLGGIQTILEEAYAGLDVDVLLEPIKRDTLRAKVERDRVFAF